MNTQNQDTNQKYKTHRSIGSYWQWSGVFYKTFRAFGYMPFELNDDGKLLPPSVSCLAWTVFAFSIQTFVFIMGAYSNARRPEYWQNYTSVLRSLIKLLVTTSLPYFLATWWNMPRVISYVREWQEFEENFKSVTGSSACVMNSLISKYQICLHFVVVVSVILLEQYLFHWRWFDPWILLPYFFPGLFELAFGTFWLNHCVSLVRTSKSYRHHLIKTLNSSAEPKLVRSYRLLWLRLQQLFTKLTATFSAAVATRLVICFTTFVFDSYTLIKAISVNDVYRAFGLVFPWLGSLIMMLAIYESCYFVNMQVGRSTLLELLYVKTQSLTPNVKKEVNLFIDSISGKSDPVDLGGFVTLDRTFAIDITRTTLTYLIVLLQFEINSPEAVS